MSGEVWQTPKTNWGVEAIPTTYYNRVEGNDSVLHRGNGQATLETVISAEELSLINETDETFLLSGSNNIKYVDSSNRQAGNRIQLIPIDGGGYLYQGESTPSDPKFKPIYWRGSSPTNTSYFLYQPITLIFTGTIWVCLPPQT